MQNKPTIRIALTEEQQAEIRRLTGKDVPALRVEALEPRIAPGAYLN